MNGNKYHGANEVSTPFANSAEPSSVTESESEVARCEQHWIDHWSMRVAVCLQRCWIDYSHFKQHVERAVFSERENVGCAGADGIHVCC